MRQPGPPQHPASSFPSPPATEAGGLVPAPALTLVTLPLSGRHRLPLRAARAFVEALYSADDRNPPPADRMDWLQGELDLLLCRVSWRSGLVYQLLLLLVCFGAPLYLRRPRPLWSLSVEDRVRALRAMERGALAAVVLAAKAIICMIYYEHPDVAREAGYTGGTTGIRT